VLAAVILSGGASQRMGSPKALLPYRGKTFLEHLREVSTHPQIRERRIVLGPHAEAIRSAVPLPDSEIVLNPDWEKGQLSSIHAAIRTLPDDLDGLILFLVDHPAVSSSLVGQLIDRFYSENPRPRIALPKYKDRRGHPVIFASSLFPELLAASMERGARDVVWSHASEVAEVPTLEEGCVLNVNDPEALQKIQKA
jgi:molybdenum cofactor cytidylyltransferase